jgi:DNA-binding NarL/FixJ family response regulator
MELSMRGPDAPSSARTTRILIMGDIRLYREGLRDILGRHPGFAVVGTAADCDEGLASVRDLRPDVVLVDMAMPESIPAVREIAAADRSAKVVALAVPEVERDVIDCAEAGVAGYVTREGSLADVVAAIDSAARDEALCSPRMAATLLRRIAVLAAEHTPVPGAVLTRRELEIVGLIDAGLSNKEIAQRLCIEVATVKNHVHNILEKLHVHRRAEAAARARPLVRRASHLEAAARN